MIIGLSPSHWTKERILANFEEVESLIKAYGGLVYAAMTQNSTRSDHATYIGSGKAEEALKIIQQEKIDIVVINANIKPEQIFSLVKIFIPGNPHIEVWDRTDLILFIFAKHAKTAEAKLQIRLASMRHMGPRIYGMGMVLSQQAGGIGTRGIGETNTELMHRHWRNELREVNKQLEKVLKNRSVQMEKRKRIGLMTISLVGYTNSGKTTLFNRLGLQKNYTDNSLFVTLDSNVCKFHLKSLNSYVYLTDTIGFIRNLPPQLIDAFKSTLLETVNSDLLLHVIDFSDEWVREKIEVVSEILQDLKVEGNKIIYVFNKSDKKRSISKEEVLNKYSSFTPQFISAKTGEGCDELISAIGEKFKK